MDSSLWPIASEQAMAPKSKPSSSKDGDDKDEKDVPEEEETEFYQGDTVKSLPPLLGVNWLYHKLALAKVRAICEC